jgi:hypothetical protein
VIPCADKLIISQESVERHSRNLLAKWVRSLFDVECTSEKSSFLSWRELEKVVPVRVVESHLGVCDGDAEIPSHLLARIAWRASNTAEYELWYE